MPLPPDLSKPIFSLMPHLADRVINGCCTFCDEFIESDGFDNEISKKEYSISGMCQDCQEETFGAFEEECSEDAPW